MRLTKLAVALLQLPQAASATVLAMPRPSSASWPTGAAQRSTQRRACRPALRQRRLKQLVDMARRHLRRHGNPRLGCHLVGAPLVWLADSPSRLWQMLTITYGLLATTMALIAGCSSWQRLSSAI